jgi:hypothetical protein
MQPRTNPPAAIRRALRQEVRFGCPVANCGSPYLSWHHFDPPWREEPHHEPDGMIALCLGHHRQADSGAFTADQLRRLKAKPYLATAGPTGTFNWKREQVIVRAGGMTAIASDVLLRFGSVNAIWLTRDPSGHEALNLDLWSRDGTPLFSLRENDWIILGKLDDVECPPAGSSLLLRAPSEGIRLGIRFRAFDRGGLADYFRKMALAGGRGGDRDRQALAARAEREGAPQEFIEALRAPSGDPELRASEQTERLMKAVQRSSAAEQFAVCELKGHLVAPVEITFTAHKLVLPGNNTFTNSTVIGSGVVLQIV